MEAKNYPQIKYVLRGAKNSKSYSLFIFRRDLRLSDNNGLNYAMKNCENIIPIFIFTPEQITKQNKYRSDSAVQFMCESLTELDKELRQNRSKLHIFYGDNIKVISKIINKIKIASVIFNMDYTPYARKRDKKIEKLCQKKEIECHIIEDYLLAPIGRFNKSNGEPYTIFTPFKNNGIKYKIDKPSNMRPKNLIKIKNIGETDIFIKGAKGRLYKENVDILVNGGRRNGLKLLKKIKNQTKYNTTRNTLIIPTTYLSAYIKFGCVSIREVYWEIKNNLRNNNLVDQLFWREFYYYIAYHFPEVLRGKNFNKKYDGIKWKWSKTKYLKWCKGETGYPIVDAGMRELNRTGFMHNRARLITSNFLNRILGMNWRWGEYYYATKLSDYDPSVNNGNWQWVSSVGVDPKPYFQRLFNPWLQSAKYDPDALYIKKWVSELKDIDPKEIHNWEDHYMDHDLDKIKYFKPIVNYKDGRNDSIKMYKKVLRAG